MLSGFSATSPANVRMERMGNALTSGFKFERFSFNGSFGFEFGHVHSS